MNTSNTTSTTPQIAFIVGMGRSGTTLLTNMLNSNPEIIACPENEFVIYSYNSFQNKDFSSVSVVDSFITIFNVNFNRVTSIWKPGNELKKDIAQLSIKSFANACKLVYLNYPLSNKNKDQVKLVVDKNPSYSLHIQTLHSLFPEAKFIVIVRDYRDNILSRKKYSDQHTPLYKLAADWNYYYDRIFKSLAKKNIPYHLIRYEDLTAKPTEELHALCNYLKIDYSEQMLNFQDFSKVMKKHAVENLSEETNKKIQRMHANLDKKLTTERVNSFINELAPKDIAILDYSCSRLAKKFGYDPHNSTITVSFITKLNYQFAYFKKLVYGVLNKIRYKLPPKLRFLSSTNRL